MRPFYLSMSSLWPWAGCVSWLKVLVPGRPLSLYTPLSVFTFWQIEPLFLFRSDVRLPLVAPLSFSDLCYLHTPFQIDCFTMFFKQLSLYMPLASCWHPIHWGIKETITQKGLHTGNGLHNAAISLRWPMRYSIFGDCFVLYSICLFSVLNFEIWRGTFCIWIIDL